MLRKIRITLASVCFVGITLLFLDFTGALHAWLGWMAKIQFLPALLALNALVITALVILTLVFGRIYCSVICPLGVFQDIAAWFGKRGKKLPYTYSKAVSWLRYLMLAVMIVAFVLGVGSVVALLAPYSAYGRMAGNLFQPLYLWGNNVLAAIAASVDSYAFYSADVWKKSLPTFIIAAVTFVVLVVLAWRNGRTYCNTICPVGTVLGFLARFSWFKIYFDGNKCRSCSLCSRNCKASCIDFKNLSVDYSRCVTCGDCLQHCEYGALHYGHPSAGIRQTNKQKIAEKAEKARQREEQKLQPAQQEATTENGVDTSRRSFLMAAALATTATAMAQKDKKVDGGLAEIVNKVAPKRTTYITPPGSYSLANMAKHCTGCQLCVSECPNGVLRPSTDITRLMQPESSYERGFCRPECTRCSEVCPTGAIKLIDKAQKSSIQIGHAVWIKKNCVPITDGVACGNCARHCPTGAISMIPYQTKDGEVQIPSVDEARCIGCGACENLCPASPFSAIYVEGHEVHKTI